ncbi:MAG: type II toxin-antitoxin system HicA family toxin [Melioribacteraceae bacterium]
MKIPRDISGEQLINALANLGYQVTRQKGSHIRLTAVIDSQEHHITIPNHSPLKIGTLNNILNDVALHNKVTKDEVMSKLF